MSLEVSLSEITFSDGTVVPLQPSSVLLLVGPNNAGKSRALRDIWERLSGEPEREIAPTAVVVDVAVRAHGDDDELMAWLDDHAHILPETVGTKERQYATLGVGNAFESALKRGWRLHQPGFGPLAPFLFALAGGEQRLGLANSTQAHDASTTPASTPLQVLFMDAEREHELAEATRDAFGVPVIVNRVAGSTIRLHLGRITPDVGLPVATNAAYRDAINSLPRVEDQGDGLRAYVGLVLMLVATEHFAVLVDEPEAFLHPPQERALGRRLAQEAVRSQSQLLVATHSLDLLLGVLRASDVNLTVVRLQRDGGINHAAVLEPEQVRKVWSDPIIRFSNALAGIFHRGVVVCEGDGDARFYDATLQAVRDRTGSGEHGLLFAHCGGKQRVPVMIGALRSLDVPVRVVCDIDVLREEQPLRRIVEALGGSWDDVGRDWGIVRAAVNSGSGSQPLVADVHSEVTTLLTGTQETRLTRGLERRVHEIAHGEDAWQALKRAGAAGLPAGDATLAWQRLDGSLRAIGLFTVPVGTLERWSPEVGGHGPRWVVRVLEQRLHEAKGPHASFVEEIDVSIS